MKPTVAAFRLPRPPSVNAAFRNRSANELSAAAARGKRMHGRAKSMVYIQWLSDAGWEVKLAKQPKIFGRYACHVNIPASDLADIDNRIKAILDLMKGLGQTGDDRLCWALSVHRDEGVPRGVVDVVLTSLEDADEHIAN